MIAPDSPLLDFWAAFRENRIAVFALGVVASIVVLAITAPLIAPQDPYDLGGLSLLDARIDDSLSMGLAYQAGTATVNGAGNTIVDPVVSGDGAID